MFRFLINCNYWDKHISFYIFKSIYHAIYLASYVSLESTLSSKNIFYKMAGKSMKIFSIHPLLTFKLVFSRKKKLYNFNTAYNPMNLVHPIYNNFSTSLFNLWNITRQSQRPSLIIFAISSTYMSPMCLRQHQLV